MIGDCEVLRDNIHAVDKHGLDRDAHTFEIVVKIEASRPSGAALPQFSLLEAPLDRPKQRLHLRVGIFGARQTFVHVGEHALRVDRDRLLRDLTLAFGKEVINRPWAAVGSLAAFGLWLRATRPLAATSHPLQSLRRTHQWNRILQFR